MLIPVIMAGGSGSRLWPLSRSQYPKQFISLNSNMSMLQETFYRLSEISHKDAIVICNEEHRFIVKEQLDDISFGESQIILEPIGRNTAPAIALAAFAVEHTLLEEDNEPIMLVLAADHAIKDTKNFIRAIQAALPYADMGKLVTFGIIPTAPETGYGYIELGNQLGTDCFEVNSFAEKPDVNTAKKYLDSKRHLWNSGIFIFKASSYLQELKKYRDDIFQACSAAFNSSKKDMGFLRIEKELFQHCPSESVDYAVMEKTSECVVVPMDAGWSDVGSWSSLWDISDKDPDGNVRHGDVICHKTLSSYVYAESGLVTTVGVKDLVIVQTKDAVLVADRNAVQDVKKVVEQIKADGRQEHQIHREVYRPWGKCDSIDEGERYQVKRITVKPGEGLSEQMHLHRAEHWIIVVGVARVTIAGEIKLLSENESIYIPVGIKHCLENPGKIPLELIEVRSGSYLGEDDIVRFADRYGRI
ncbi:mannose-1-phosphate guanylyltransferase/mannose-6-phosphate isomerase [Citrobacter portucalensis]|uniref:mannose-1-phosphate guanylyltransferase/mannose-6-phosphate isomerase n=1 Tax=Citrobacter portucalensis TaxID=1639133 RepID=UPI00254DA64F|nr:mannose-1-phosphate guanylyltransferase/mannose-6-phosphate isomerase [Citrobacter portucalensis]